MKNKIMALIITIIVVIIAIGGACILKNNDNRNISVKITNSRKKRTNTSYNVNLIKRVNTLYQDNFLISPYSIEVALNMLKKGSTGNTKEEIRNFLPNRTINNIEIKNRVGIANGLFINDIYSNAVEKRFIDTLQTDYNSEIIYDSFISPNIINNWVNEKTNGMIPKVLDNISNDYVLGLTSALAIDVDWMNGFKCTDTQESIFTKSDGSKISVEMMNQDFSSNTKYFETKKAKGIIIPYEKYDEEGNINEDGKKQLEFIGILPNNNLKKYIKELTDDEIKYFDTKAKDSSKESKHVISIPRFSYEFDLKDLKDILVSFGIKDAFDKGNANFTNIISKEKLGNNNLYVSGIFHKTKIDFNEKGTKADATTQIGMYVSGYKNNDGSVEIKFDKPFLYMIRDMKTKEILFVGKVEEPNLWKGSTCSN